MPRTTMTPAEKREAAKAKAADTLAQLQGEVAKLTTSEEWLRALAFSARFHNYSFGNVLLIHLQCPEATQVAGFRKWQELGRQVRKGEKGIAILAPRSGPCRDCNGQGKVQGMTCGRCWGSGKWLAFGTAYVFDVSQTDGEELPVRPRPQLLQGNDETGLYEAAKAAAIGLGWTAVEGRTRADLGGANGHVTVPSSRVDGAREWVIASDTPPAQRAKTAVHELAHIVLGHTDARKDTPRDVAEVEAESVAYVVGQVLGLDSVAYSVPYVATWGKEGKAVEAAGKAILKAVGEVLDLLTPQEASDQGEEVMLAAA